MNKNKANFPRDCDFILISDNWSIGVLEYWPPAPLPARRAYRPEDRSYGSERVMAAKPTTLFQHSNTPSLQYPMIDRLLDCKESSIYLIIDYSSVLS
jgi:hypothetical protein